VITLDQPDAAARAVHVLHRLLPDLPILARAQDVAQCERLARAGATRVVPEVVEGSLQLGGSLLRRLGASPDEVEQLLEAFRRSTYSQVEDVMATRSFLSVKL
jgi:monovalent cation:H+ antiporter-2, CPA2 family